MGPSLQSVIGVHALAEFEAPAPVARGLPAAAYTSEAFFALENERIFSRSWVFAGFAHELSRPGDAVPVAVAGRPVLLVRDTAGEVRAFHNVCRHRCLKLVDEPGNVGRAIRCPYHSWTYGLDGALRAAPYFGGREPRAAPAGFDRSQHGLVPVRSAVWHDWVFVNLDGSAPPFEEFIAPLRSRLDGLDLPRMQHLATIDLGEVAANWKLLMENFIEPYHVQFVHSRTTDQPLVDHYTVNEPGCLGCAVDVSREAGKTDVLSQDSRFLTLFPNFRVRGSISRTRSACISTCRLRRAAPSRGAPSTAWSLHRFRPGAQTGLQRSGARSISKTTPSASGCSRGAPAMWLPEAAYISPVWEDSVRNFQNLVIERLR